MFFCCGKGKLTFHNIHQSAIEKMGKKYWSVRNLNAFFSMINQLMTARSDELIVRESCTHIMRFIQLVPEKTIKLLMGTQLKLARAVFSKLSRVSTYFTQLRLIEILRQLFRHLDDEGRSILQSQKTVDNDDGKRIQAMIKLFLEVNLEDPEQFFTVKFEFASKNIKT